MSIALTVTDFIEKWREHIVALDKSRNNELLLGFSRLEVEEFWNEVFVEGSFFVEDLQILPKLLPRFVLRGGFEDQMLLRPIPRRVLEFRCNGMHDAKVVVAIGRASFYREIEDS